MPMPALPASRRVRSVLSFAACCAADEQLQPSCCSPASTSYRACSSLILLLMGSMSRSARAATSSPRSSTAFWSCLALACNETHRERSPSSTTTSCRFLAVQSSGYELELGPGCRVLVESEEVFNFEERRAAGVGRGAYEPTVVCMILTRLLTYWYWC